MLIVILEQNKEYVHGNPKSFPIPKNFICEKVKGYTR
jgi:hypothetical protein